MSFSFFAVQIELWRIGSSDFAPRFSVVAKPNNWSKQGQAIKQAAEGELTETQKAYRAFWSSLIEKAKGRYPALAARSPYKGSWQTAEQLRGGNPGFSANAAFPWDKSLRCEIYIDGTLAKAAFHRLQQQRPALSRPSVLRLNGKNCQMRERPGLRRTCQDWRSVLKRAVGPHNRNGCLLTGPS